MLAMYLLRHGIVYSFGLVAFRTIMSKTSKTWIKATEEKFRYYNYVILKNMEWIVSVDLPPLTQYNKLDKKYYL